MDIILNIKIKDGFEDHIEKIIKRIEILNGVEKVWERENHDGAIFYGDVDYDMVSQNEFMQRLEDWEDGSYFGPDYFIYQGRNFYTAVDNYSGEFFIEKFKEIEDAIAWLNGEEILIRRGKQ